MQIPEFAKKPPIIIGGIVLFVIIILAARKGQSSASASTSDYANSLATTQASNIEIARINADIQKAQIAAGVQQSELGATERVALSKLTIDENVALQTSSYAYDLSNKQLENNRILGLTKEDTTRLLSTQDNQTRLTLGITTLDTQKYLGTLAINSAEAQQAREIQFRNNQLDSQERVADFTSSRSLTYAQIQGQSQVDAIKANKPKWYESFLGALGGGLAHAIVP